MRKRRKLVAVKVALPRPLLSWLRERSDSDGPAGLGATVAELAELARDLEERTPPAPPLRFH